MGYPKRYLQGVMWTLRKRAEQVTSEDKEKLDRLFTHAPQLKVAYDLCKALTEIFDRHMTKRRAKYALKHWMKRVKGAQLQVRGLVQAEQSIKASVDPSEPKVQEMVETVLTPPHPDPFEALLNEPFTRTLDHATTQR